MSYRPQIKKSDGTMQDLPLDAETIKGQEVKGLAFKDTIKNDDIANDAAIAQSKVSGLSTSLSAKIDKSGGELKDTVVTFDDVSGMAANIASGETAKTLFGKIKNWFGRLKTLAFKDTIKNDDIASDAAIAQNKIYGLRTDYVASLSVSGKTVTYKNKSGGKIGTFTTQDTTYSNATTVYDGLMSSEDKTKLNGIDSNANNYTLPQATRAALGGVKIGYTKNGDNYPVQLSSSGQMFVTVSGGGGDSGSGGGGDSPYYIKGTIEITPVYSDYFSFNIQSIVHGAEIASSTSEMQAMILDICQKLQNNENLSMMYCGTLNVGGNSDTVTFPLSVYRESSTTLTIGGRAQTEDGGFQGSRCSVDISCRLSANSSSIVLSDRMCSATPTTYFGRLPLIAGRELNHPDLGGYGFNIQDLANLGLIPAPLENNIYEIIIPYIEGMDMELDVQVACNGVTYQVFSNTLPQTSYTLRLYGNSQFDHNGDGTIRAEFIAMRDGNVGSPSNVVTGISFGDYASWDSVGISLGSQGNVIAYMRVTPIAF